MFITRKSDYALRVLIYLVNNKDKAVTAAELSSRLKVPRQFLAKIINILSSNGIVEAKIGKNGGVRIKNEKISIAKLLYMLGANMYLNKCLMKGFSCDLSRKCPLHYFLAGAQEELIKKLERVSLQQIALSV